MNRRTIQLLAAVFLAGSALAQGPFMATGFKVGEVTDASAIVWTRLTRHPERNPADGPMVTIRQAEGARGRRRAVVGIDFPDGATVADLKDAAPGAAGEVRVLYRKASSESFFCICSAPMFE